MRAVELYRKAGKGFQEGRVLLRAGTSRLSDRPGEAEALLRKARALLLPFGPTKTLAKCLSALASARLFAGDIAKAQKRKNGEVVVSEFLKDEEDANKEFKKDEGKNYAETQLAKKERYMKRADIQEALNIAADLAVMEGAGVAASLADKEGSKEEPKSEKPEVKAHANVEKEGEPESHN